MSLHLKPDVEALVHETVETGYRDASEVVEAAVKLLRERDNEKLEALKAAIEEGEEDIRQGRYVDFATPEELKVFLKSL